MINDLYKYIKGSLMHRLTRSSLTILSIVLGIMAIYALVSFGQGLGKYVDEVAGDFGTDKLIAQPRTASAPGQSSSNFNRDDLEFLESQNSVAIASEGFISQLEVRQNPDDKGKWMFVMALPTEKEKYDTWMFSYDIYSGRNLKKGDRYKVMLGYNHQVPDKIWNKPFAEGKNIYLNGIGFEIVGFLESVGNPQDDSNVYIPIEMLEEVFEVEDEFNYIIMQAQPGVEVSKLAERLEEKLAREKGQDEGQKDFYIMSFEEQMEVFTSIIGVLNGVLVLIAGVSILVAAVNIANTMYTAVIERTKEIGVMKAIGSTNSYIMSIFVIESGVLGLLGGAMGVLLGYLIAITGGNIAADAGYAFLKPYFPLWLTIGCLLFAMVVGTISGFLPARQAAKLKPVDALRYE